MCNRPKEILHIMVYKTSLKLHLAYVLRWNRGKNIYFFSSYLITLGKDVTLPLITKFKNKQASE